MRLKETTCSEAEKGRMDNSINDEIRHKKANSSKPTLNISRNHAQHNIRRRFQTFYYTEVLLTRGAFYYTELLLTMRGKLKGTMAVTTPNGSLTSSQCTPRLTSSFFPWISCGSEHAYST